MNFLNPVAAWTMEVSLLCKFGIFFFFGRNLKATPNQTNEGHLYNYQRGQRKQILSRSAEAVGCKNASVGERSALEGSTHGNMIYVFGKWLLRKQGICRKIKAFPQSNILPMKALNFLHQQSRRHLQKSKHHLFSQQRELL
ncbi:hypothetical protein ACOSP7_010604 [Xanthoceras sorbifolium]